MSDEIKSAFEAIKAEIHTDMGYAWAWHCNIAVPIMDGGCTHKQANETAALIMSQMFNYDITQCSHYLYGKLPQQEYFEARIAAERDEDRTLQGMEAGTGETERLDPQGDSPVGKADAAKDSQP